MRGVGGVLGEGVGVNGKEDPAKRRSYNVIRL